MRFRGAQIAQGSKAVLFAAYDFCSLVFFQNVIIAQRARVAAVPIGDDQLVAFKRFIFLDAFKKPPERVHTVAVGNDDCGAPASAKRDAHTKAARERARCG